jgi:hypothetical protein
MNSCALPTGDAAPCRRFWVNKHTASWRMHLTLPEFPLSWYLGCDVGRLSQQSWKQAVLVNVTCSAAQADIQLKDEMPPLAFCRYSQFSSDMFAPERCYIVLNYFKILCHGQYLTHMCVDVRRYPQGSQ